MKKRILYVIDGIEFGGGERVFAQLLNGLPEDRFEPYLASAPNDAFLKNIKSKNLVFYPVDFSNRFNPLPLMRLYRIVKSQRIDIVHSQGARADFFARIAAKLAKVPIMISTVAMPVEGYNVGYLKRFLYQTFDRFSERFVDYFLVVSSVLKENMIEVHGIPPDKIIKIYNGIETDYYKPVGNEEMRYKIRREFAVNDSDILIASLGRLVWQKGFEYFLHAIPEILREIPDARFILVGDGPLRPELERLAVELGEGDKIIFAGYRSDVRDVLAALDIVVIPSVLEGFPMITLEAMAMAKPIVAAKIDGITEQITDGINGILIPPKDSSAIAQAIIRLINDRESGKKLGLAARKRVEQEFSVEKMVAEIEKVYSSLPRAG